jgi:hypothetical protein
MIAYKLFSKKKDGSIGPLFINRRQRLAEDVWYEAEDHPTKGYAHRPGWHCTLRPEAPHLSERGREWHKVEVRGLEYFRRPESQGGVWVLAQELKVLEVV